MIRINLLPYREARRLQKVQEIAIIWAGVALFGLLTAVGVDFYYASLVEEQNLIKAENQKELDRLTNELGALSDLKTKKAMIQKRLDVVATLNLTRDLGVHVLDELAKNIPDMVWLTSLTSAGNKLTLAGLAETNTDVAHFMTRLSSSPYFTNVELIQTTQKMDQGHTLKAFSLSALMGVPAPVENKSAKPISSGAATAPAPQPTATPTKGAKE